MNRSTIGAETSARSSRLKWPYAVLAAAMMFVAMIPYGPIWYTWATVGVAMAVGSSGMVFVGIFLLVDALKRRHHFALQMAALFMSTYVAAAIISWHVIRPLFR